MSAASLAPGTFNFMESVFSPEVAARHRGAILAFDSVEALRAAYHSPVSVEGRADEQRLLANPRALLIDGQEIL